MSSLSAPYLHDEAAAHEFVESVLWPDGPHCPRCGSLDRITKVKANPAKRIRVGLTAAVLQTPVHCQGRHGLRGQQDCAQPVAPGRSVDDGQQEGY